MSKTILVKNFPRVSNLQKEKDVVFNTIQKIFLNFPSEHNTNIMHDCLVHFCNSINNYVYVPKKFNCWDGRYVAFIDKRNPLKMKIVHGGFITNDNGFSLSVINNNKVLKFNKNNFHIFMLLNSRDEHFAKLYSYL